jgi:hypothetical protein
VRTQKAICEGRRRFVRKKAICEEEGCSTRMTNKLVEEGGQWRRTNKFARKVVRATPADSQGRDHRCSPGRIWYFPKFIKI